MAYWRQQRNCGVNCLYVLLKSHGFDPAYHALVQRVGELSPHQDPSLADLALIAREQGMRCSVGKTSPDGLRQMNLPVIAHWEMEGSPQSGHFVLVVECTDEGVRFIDGTSGAVGEAPWREFAQCWTGYALYPSPTYIDRLSWWWPALGSLVLGSAGVLVWRAWLGPWWASCRRTALKPNPRPGETDTGAVPTPSAPGEPVSVDSLSEYSR